MLFVRSGPKRRCILILALVAALGCRGAFRAPVDGVAPDRSVEASLLQGMNAFILTGLVSPDLVVEIDWVAGSEPSPAAVRALESVLSRHCSEGKRIRVLTDEEIPLESWEAVDDREDLARLIGLNLDHDPSDWQREEVVYVLYAPGGRGIYGPRQSGMADTFSFERGHSVTSVSAMLLFSEEIRRQALLWIGAAKVERATMVHELGHLLGLVSNPEHLQRDHPGHCTEPQCVMNQPRLRSTLYNALPALFAGQIPTDYCKRCRADLATVQRLWRGLASENPDLADEIRSSRLEALARVARRGGRDPAALPLE